MLLIYLGNDYGLCASIPAIFVTVHYYFTGYGASSNRGCHAVNTDRFNAFDSRLR